MNKSNKLQAGFSAQLIVIIIAVTAIIGVLGWRFVDANSKANVSQQTETKKPAQLSPVDQQTLEQANELKKVDLDLDGVVNSQDTDDDNDGAIDTQDADDDNDGKTDVEDTDNDNDGTSDDDDNEAEQQAELEHGDDR
jgi:hypothetical protein